MHRACFCTDLIGPSAVSRRLLLDTWDFFQAVCGNMPFFIMAGGLYATIIVIVLWQLMMALQLDSLNILFLY